MASKVKAKKKTLTPEEVVQRDQKSRTRAFFRLSGFKRISRLEDKEFTFLGTTCDIDDVFYLENVIVFVEYTVTKKITDHLKKKSIPFRKIVENPTDFLEYLESGFPAFSEALVDPYDHDQRKIFILYASRHPVSSTTKAEVPAVGYLDYNVIRYLESVARSVRGTAKYEILEFLGVEASEFGSAALNPASSSAITYEGTVLPEAHSNFGNGFKVVSFYVDPDALLRRAYVLRRDGWRAGDSLYQRMISRGKIEGIRRYLKDNQRVFVNNIIVTLPSQTKIVTNKGETVDTKTIKKTQRARIQVPDSFGSVGIVDGQHRLFAYHEGGSYEAVIDKLRKRQNLLITGIMFPDDYSAAKKLRFEANLFLEINSKQTGAKSELKQDIELILSPYSATAIAKRVMIRLNETGPLADQFEKFFFDKGRMKTTSIVSYALVHLVRIGGPDSLFTDWSNALKNEVQNRSNDAALEEYVKYCSAKINEFLVAAQKAMPSHHWTPDKKVAGYFLTTTSVNSLLSLFRRMVRNKKIYNPGSYSAKFAILDTFDFKAFKSSQYNRVGESLYVAMY